MLVRPFLERCAACASGCDHLIVGERVGVGVELAAELRGAARVGALRSTAAGARAQRSAARRGCGDHLCRRIQLQPVSHMYVVLSYS